MTSSESAETILPFPSPCATVRNARSTIILGAIASLRQAGHFERYTLELAPEHRDHLLQTVAGVWIPVDVARSHYRACEALSLSVEAETQLGRAIFERTGDTMFGTVMRLAKGAGVTPWTVLPQLQRFWERGYDGGGLRVLRVGPKEARIDLVQCALTDSRYFRNAVRGLIGSLLELFCSRMYLHEISAGRTPGTMAVRAQWA